MFRLASALADAGEVSLYACAGTREARTQRSWNEACPGAPPATQGFGYDREDASAVFTWVLSRYSTEIV